MKKLEEIKKNVKANKERILALTCVGGCIAGCIAISVWEHNHLKTVYVDDWNKLNGSGPFDQLLDKPISGAFATVEYNDGEIGVINLDCEDTVVDLFKAMFPGVLQEK